MIHGAVAPDAASALILSPTASNDCCRESARIHPPIIETGAATADTRAQPGTLRPVRAVIDGPYTTATIQGSRHGAIVRAGSGAGFDLVAQDEISTGVAGLGGGEVLTQLGDGCCGAPGRQRVKADRQDTVAGVDVTAAGQRLTDQGVRFVVRAGVPGMDSDRSGQGGGCVERCDADAVADQLGLYGQDLLAGVDLAQRQPGRDAPCLLYTSDAADEEDSV